MALKRSDRKEKEKDPFIDDVADEDDDEEEEEDGDYDDEDDVRPRKRKAYNPFIDEMAVVDDDEDEDEEDEDYEKEDGFIEEVEEDLGQGKGGIRRHMDLDRQRRELETMDEEQIAAFYTKKYGSNYRRGHMFTQAEDVPQQLLYPSVNDPNLWMVKCKPGKERDIIFGLMKRYFDRLHGPHPLSTFSAFARESLKGYIYIEARKQAHVQEALLNIPNVYMTTLMLVPISDMIGAITVQKKTSPVNIGAWVRIKRGTYAGDLGQVVELNDTQESAVVKVVPRLDIENNNSHQDEFNVNGKRGKSKVRPPPRFFNPERLANRSYSSLQKKGPYWVYNGDSFRDGYLEKSMKVATLQLEGVNPTLEEIAKFAGNNELTNGDGERALDIASLSNLAISNTKEQASLFLPGDVVTVVEGDMIHATGTVDNVKDTSVTVNLKVDGNEKKVTLPARQLRKTFKEGDHVKVINGRFKDESGLVLKVDGNIVTLLSDASLKEVKVFAKDLREAAEVMFGKTVIGDYELHDLVQLDFHTVGVIVKVNRDSFQILTQNGEMRTVEPHQITNKRDSTRAVATDANGNSIRDGDTVTEVGSKRSCSILHLYRQLVFLHSREHTDNYGVWVTNTRSIVSASPKTHFLANTTTQNPNMLPQRGDFNGRGGFDARGGRGGRGGMRGGFMGRGRGGRDNLVAKTVRISQGPHKGYIGIVKDTTDTHARVELHTNSKVLSIDKSHLTILDAQGNPIGQAAPGAFAEPLPVNNNNGGFARPMGTPSRFNEAGSKTPAWSSSRTPNPYAADGGRTPAWNSGSKTPAWSSSARTPNPYARNNDGGRTPAWDSGSKTPAYNRHGDSSSSSAWNTSSSRNSRELYTSSSVKTPAYNGRPNEPETAPTPGSSWNTAPTPAASTIPYDIRAPTPAAANSSGGHMVPPTPYGGLNVPATPYESAPTPGGNLGVPATPAAMMSAPTPGINYPTTPGANMIPSTPGAPLSSSMGGSNKLAPTTPFMPSGGDYNSDVMGDMDGFRRKNNMENNANWPIEDIAVALKRDEEITGRIVSVKDSIRKCVVIMDEDGSEKELSIDDIKPVIPNKKEPVRIMQGEYRGELGTLIGVDSQDGIVNMKNSGGTFKIVHMAHVAKYTGTESVQ